MSGTLVGENELRRIAQEAVRLAGGDAEALVIAKTEALTRYANAAIHQNVHSREVELRLRVVRGKRVASVTTDRLDPAGLRALARDAADLAKAAPENPRFAGLPGPRPIAPAPSAYTERTAASTPLDRARMVDRICGPARAKKLSAAGFVATTVQELAVASSLGTWAYWPQTLAHAQCVAIGDAGSAFAERVAQDVADVDVDAVASEAIGKAVAAQGPRDLAAGEHEVVLETYAVNDILQFLAGSLTGNAVEEGRSFVSGKLGQKVTGPVTIVEDPFYPRGLPRPFDFEGQPSERLVLIEDGVARAVVYDSQTAHRVGAKSTGHALPPNPSAPAMPMRVRLEPGTSTRAELIKGVKRGVLVTRFHYTRWVHQPRTIVTGMTREGTFAIEDGEIAHPVKNFRFTQSYHDALSATLGIGKDLSLFGVEFGPQTSTRLVPALRLASFAFTGTTQY